MTGPGRSATVDDERAGGVRTSRGFSVIARHPYRSFGAVLAVFAASLFLAGMIGQFNDGPWGGLPEWLGGAAYATWMLSIPVLVVLSVYLGIHRLRTRRAA